MVRDTGLARRLLFATAAPIAVSPRPPVTGLLMVFCVTFGGDDTPRAMGQQAQPMTVHDTVLAAGASRDLSGMVWMRAMGPRTMLRHTDGTQFQGLFVTADGIVPVPRNIPRAIHKGIWSVRGLLVVNLLISGVSAALWVTGLWLWLRRCNRRRPDRAAVVV